MLLSNDRDRLRQRVRDAWQRHRRGEPLEALDRQIVDLVRDHPEYHALLERDEDANADDFRLDEGANPFLHLALHLALREQVGTDRPAGIAAITRALLLRLRDGHEVEHRMIGVLAESLWEAQQQGGAPDETRYLERLRRL